MQFRKFTLDARHVLRSVDAEVWLALFAARRF